MELSETAHAGLIKQIPGDAKVSLAVDAWSTPDRKAFLATTLYFITDDWQYVEVLLAFQPLREKHDGETLATTVLGALQKFDLTNRILAWTTDNASNNSTMVAAINKKVKATLSRPEFLHSAITPLHKLMETQHHIPCLVHVIQLAVRKILENLKVDAQNDTASMEWKTTEAQLSSHTGMPRTLEKVSAIV